MDVRWTDLVFYSFENPNDGIEQNFRKGRQAK